MLRTLAIIGCLFIGGVSSDAAKKDLAKLQGDWVMASLEVNGIDVPPEKLGSSSLTIKDNIYTVKVKDMVHNVQITLDPSKSPPEFDMFFQDGGNKDQTAKAIYKIDGDTFKVSRGLAPQQDRPREFTTAAGTNIFVVTWKKK